MIHGEYIRGEYNTRTKYAKYTYMQYKTRIHTRGKVDEGRGIKRKKLYKKKNIQKSGTKQRNT